MLENCYQKEPPEAGCDEAVGAGTLRGLFAAAVMLLLPTSATVAERFEADMTARQRDLLRAIVEREALCLGHRPVSAERTTRINILNACSKECRWRSRNCRSVRDFWRSTATGSARRSTFRIAASSWRGKYADIAAASVLAKTHRDEYMERLRRGFSPNTVGERNKGYPTREHRLRRSAVTGLRPTTG